MRRGLLIGLSLLAVAMAGRASALDPPVTPGLDYADQSNWVCRPDAPACHDDLTAAAIGADGHVRIEHFQPTAHPKIDCFYVYPTVSMSREVNAPPGVTEAERRSVRQQAERLASVCRLYVPFYRQFTVGHMELHKPATPAEMQTGYRLADADIFAAWTYYLAHDNHGRGVVLVGHSQGAGVLQDLIHHRIEGHPDQTRIVSAVLPGSGVTAPKGQDVGGTFKSIPACRREDQTGCVIVFNSFRPDVLMPHDQIPSFPGGDPLCTNPATLAGGRGVLKPYFSTSGETIIPDFTAKQAPWTASGDKIEAPFVTLPGYYAAECRSDGHWNYLAVIPQPQPGDQRTGALVGDWIQDGKRYDTMGLHLIDLNLVMGNLIEVLKRQADAWCAKPGAVCN
ncbi:MAG TPA: DUF3089 domain-containing protein [Phenylobacterium sp.]|jgi:hypothetical protein|uniref:DUF3089 domain-containing protein n=1 Tax=Phenylobacterium sp. TaxID=1871053 RepID=UPI002D280792|nr:DUF3089 domain-containing protein [Phenylobacterium sp.]HZZ68842.1 DUF3089 domain-containing protein [Phenylobacterium sp.]